MQTKQSEWPSRVKHFSQSLTPYLPLIVLLFLSPLLLLHLLQLTALRASVASQSEQISELRGRLKDNQVGGSSSTLPSTGLRAQAMERYRQAKTRGDYDLAEVYLLNAIQRDPHDVELLGEYVDFLVSSPDVGRQSSIRARSLLEGSLFSVSPEKVQDVGKLIAKIQQASAKPPASPSIPPTPAKDWMQLKAGPSNPFDALSVQTHLDNLTDFASTLSEESQKSLLDQVEVERNQWREAADVLSTVAFIDSCQRNLDTLDARSQAAVAVVQSAENALPTLWSVNLANLPPQIRSKVEAYPTQIQDWVEKIAVARSKDATSRIQKQYEASRSPVGENQEQRCHAIETSIKEVQALVDDVPSKKMQHEATVLHGKMLELLQEQRQKQYDLYQKFVVDKCAAVFGNFNGQWVITESEAVKLFNDNKLYEVDQRHLSPEVAQCFNELLNKLFVEAGPEKIVECQKKLCLAEKKSLEDF